MTEKSIKDAKVNKKELKKLAKQVSKTEEGKEIKKFLIILGIVVIIAAAAYFLTKNYVVKDNKTSESKTEVTFDYTKTILGSLFNRPYNEYYVLVYNSKDLQANYYANLVSSYQNKENALKIYTADLNDSMNEKFYDKNESNPKATEASELKVKDLTLIKIKDKKISKYLEDVDSIKQELGL